MERSIKDLKVVIKGAGDLASGVAWRLFQSNIQNLLMLEVEKPLAVRRKVSFCEALIYGETTVEGVQAIRASNMEEMNRAWEDGQIPVMADPSWSIIETLKPDIVVDAILAKRNLGTAQDEADLVMGLGPGFTAGKDVHMVIETNRGHNLGRVLTSGAAEPNTGAPGEVMGFSTERVLRAPDKGGFKAEREIGDIVKQGDLIGHVDGTEVFAGIDGMIRGLIMSNIEVQKGMKIGDIDPRGADASYNTISDKALAIGGGVLEGILSRFNQ